MNKFSVLLSVYHKEKPEYLEAALDSVYSSNVLPDEVVLVEDGPLNDELYEILDKYADQKGLVRVPLLENKGLSQALNCGLKVVSNNLVARMDTDDICHKTRFEKQLKVFESNKNLMIVGSDVDEFIVSPEEIVSVKKMPRTKKEIESYASKRNPFNHPSVMYKKEVIESVGNYKEMPLFEDYYLWLRVLDAFPQRDTLNIGENLVSMRTVDDLYKRRGGLSYCSKIFNFRKTCYKEELINFSDFIIYGGIVMLIAILPNWVRKFFYQKALR